MGYNKKVWSGSYYDFYEKGVNKGTIDCSYCSKSGNCDGGACKYKKRKYKEIIENGKRKEK